MVCFVGFHSYFVLPYVMVRKSTRLAVKYCADDPAAAAAATITMRILLNIA